MRIYIQVKKLGRRCCVEAVPFELDIIPATVGELLEEVVLRLADNYNANLGANDILSCISDSAIHDMAVSGKVGLVFPIMTKGLTPGMLSIMRYSRMLTAYIVYLSTIQTQGAIQRPR